MAAPPSKCYAILIIEHHFLTINSQTAQIVDNFRNSLLEFSLRSKPTDYLYKSSLEDEPKNKTSSSNYQSVYF
jgi:hypothetical protein